MQVLCVEDDHFFFKAFGDYALSVAKEKNSSVSISRVGTVDEAVACVMNPETRPDQVFFDFDLNPNFKDPFAPPEDRVSALTRFVDRIGELSDMPEIHVMSGITLALEPVRQSIRHHLRDRRSIVSVLRKNEADLLNFAIRAMYQPGIAVIDQEVAQIIDKAKTEDHYLGNFTIPDLPKKVQALSNTQWEVALRCSDGLTRNAIAQERNVTPDSVAQSLGKTRDIVLGDELNPALAEGQQSKAPAPGAFVRFVVERYLQKYGNRNRDPYL